MAAEPRSRAGVVRDPADGDARRWLLAFILALPFLPIAMQLWPGTDQKLFLDYSAELLSGASLYVDLWDNKQPGIFWLYGAIQGLLGVGWSKVLLGYSAWMCAAAASAALVVRIAAPASRSAWLFAVPLTLGVVWLRSNYDQVAQIEEWAALPLTCILLLSLRPEAPGEPARLRWVVVGVLAGVVSVLKLVLAPVPVAIAAAVFAARMATDRLPARHLLAALGCATAGAALVWGGVLAWFAASGRWDVFWWTTFDYPRLAVLATERAPWSRLAYSAGWLAKSTLPLWPAIVLALVAAARAPRSPLARVVVGAIAWWCAGLAMILAQKFSWWAYHLPLLVWPMGLLAAIGCATAWPGQGPARWLPRAAQLACATGLALYAGHVATKWTRGTDWPYLEADRAVMEKARDVAGLATVTCGTAVAIGDQNGLQSVTGLKRAMATNAVFWGAYLPAQVSRLPAELRAARPDLVFMDGDQRDWFASRRPEVLAAIEGWLAEEYVPRGTDGLRGRWWERAPAARGGDCPSRAPFVVPDR